MLSNQTTGKKATYHLKRSSMGSRSRLNIGKSDVQIENGTAAIGDVSTFSQADKIQPGSAQDLEESRSKASVKMPRSMQEHTYEDSGSKHQLSKSR